jgi:hypothetical protein
MMKDQFSISLLKAYFKVEGEKVFPEEVVNAFKKSSEKKRVPAQTRGAASSNVNAYHIIDFIRALKSQDVPFESIFPSPNMTRDQFTMILDA